MVRFLTELQSITGDDRVETQKLLSYAVAVLAATRSSLPNDRVDSPWDYYLSAHGVGNDVFLSRVNEASVYDTEFTRDRLRAFWEQRYYFAYPRSVNDLMTQLSVGEFISQADREYLIANNSKLVRVIDVLVKHFFADAE